MTYDNGSGYIFATTYDGITQMSPDPKQIGTNRMDVLTGGRKLSQELMDGARSKGEVLLQYEYEKPGQEGITRKIGYAAAVPGFDMYMGTGAYLDDLAAKLRPIVWLLGLSTIAIGAIAGVIAWVIGRGIARPLNLLGARMEGIAKGELQSEIPGVGRGDEVGKMAATVQIFKDNALRMRELEKAETETRERAAADRRSAMEGLAGDFERSVNGIVRSVSTAAAGMQTTAQSMTATASDAACAPPMSARLRRAPRAMSARLRPPPRNCRVRSPKSRGRLAVPATSPARPSPTPSARMLPCRCFRPVRKKSARWSS